jgi:predicted DsbA family dithiol-disulfide isomerase
MSAPAKLRIDIVSDVVCPWCIIGYKGLEAALERLGDGVAAEIEWHPFELAPDMPPEGQSTTAYVGERYGATPEQSESSRKRITAAGAALGIAFNYGPQSRMYNSFKAHQLLHWAKGLGKQTELKLTLFQAYFADQLDISSDIVLLDAAEFAGLDRGQAADVLADARFAGTVRAEENFWQEQNITGVPAFIVNGKYMIPGAQDAETFGRYLERIIEKEQTAAT